MEPTPSSPWVVPDANLLDRFTELSELFVVNYLGEEHYCFYREILEGVRKELSKMLNFHPPPVRAGSPDGAYLFDLSVDPYEEHNLYHWHPELAEMMLQKLRRVMDEVPHDFCDWRFTDPLHTHELFQGEKFHAPWLDDDVGTYIPQQKNGALIYSLSAVPSLPFSPYSKFSSVSTELDEQVRP